MTRRNRYWLIAILVPAVLAGLVTFGVLYLQSAATFTGSGTVTLTQVQDSTCTGTYGGITSGAQVTVTDPKGVVVSVGQIGRAKVSANQATTPFGDGQVKVGGVICEFPFTAPKVPTGKKFYGVNIGTYPRYQVSETDLRGGLKLR